MKQEEVNQGVRRGELVVVATAKLREKIIERVQRLIDDAPYVALSDVLREMDEIKRMLTRMGNRSRRYSVALAADMAKSVMLALLLIPERQEKIPRAGDESGPAQAAAELAKAGDDARRIADKLWGGIDPTPTIEAWHRELAKAADPTLTEQLLVATRTEDAKAHDPKGRPYTEIPAAPKSLPSAKVQEVELLVRTVDEDPGVALVRVESAADPDGPAMEGLFERRLRLVFDEESHPGVAKFLELAQVTDVHVRTRVHVTRGLGAFGAKHDELRLAEVIDEAESRRRMSRRLLEMNAVTGDLFAEQSLEIEEDHVPEGL